MMTLQSYRAAQGLTQMAFAKLVEVDQSVISKIERRLAVPSLDLAIRIEDATDGEVTAKSWVNNQQTGAT